VVEALLDEETDDPVGVEDEISTVCVYIADLAVWVVSLCGFSCFFLQKRDLITHLRRAIN